MRVRIIAVLIGLVLIASACSSSDSGEASADTESPTTVAAGTEATTAPAAGATTTAAAQESGNANGGGGTATVTLENGESYSFEILCGLEPQEVAGQEILFNFVSYDDPYGLDVTQFGKGSEDTFGQLDDLGGISIYDSTTFDEIWTANTVAAQLSETDFLLELDGNTITGSGTFFTAEAVENLDMTSGVLGELVANCS
jgi:hypothetical protein